MKQEHHLIDIKTVNGGADSDSEKEFIGSNEGGKYVDAVNAAPTSVDGNSEALTKIRGEEVKYNDGGNAEADNYTCIGSISCNGKLIEFWAHNTGDESSLIRIDGNIVLESEDFPFDAQHPLQIDVNENMLGGEIAFTNNKEGVPPMILNVQDMIDNSTVGSTPSEKYYTAFNPDLYFINIQSPLDIPVFYGLENVGGGGGLPVGAYSYSIRYVTKEGDTTNWSQETPLIPVVQNVNNTNKQYPGYKTYAAEPNPSSRTRYGIKLKFRITNLHDYDFVEVKRIEHNQGAGIGFQPIQKIITRLDVFPGEISVREFIDPEDSDEPVVISDTEAVQELAYIERSKGIRYFDRRIELMNVKLASKEANIGFVEVDGKKVFPVIDKLGKSGFNDPWNQTYRKAFMGGERYGIGVNLFDGIAGRGFAVNVPTPDVLHPTESDFQYPNRRNIASDTTKNYSYNGTVKAATTDPASLVDQTHEVFDLTDAVQKDDTCSFKNIFKADKVIDTNGFKTKISVNFPKFTSDGSINGVSHLEDDKVCPTVDDPTDGEIDSELENHGTRVSALGNVFPFYHPYTPTKQNDPDETGLNYAVNLRVGYGKLAVAPDADTELDYYPKGFGPNYYANGLALGGINNLPKWAKAFSVVRSDAAGRVVAQGMGFYKLSPAIYQAIGAKKGTTKDKDSFVFFSPDIENGFVSSDLVNDIVNNPENYQIQLVSPLGFFSEVYSFENRSNPFYARRDLLTDMIVYARIITDKFNSEINPNDPLMGIQNIPDFSNYVGYGKYRNDTDTQDDSGYPTSSFDGDRVYDIITSKRVAEGRGGFMEIQVDGDIYGVNGTGGDAQFNEDGMKNWTEPLYIVNIVKTGAKVKDQNINKFKATTHYQKIESIIGLSNGNVGQSFELIDERWEDCIPSINSSSYGASTNRYIYIKQTDGTELKYVNGTFKTGPEIAAINADITANGFWGDNVVGIYSHTNVDNANRVFNVNFNLGYTPPLNSQIIVKYDNTAPIRFWGGDSFVGEALFAPIDRECDAEEDAATTQFALGIGFPYNMYRLNPRHYIIRDTTGANTIQDINHCWLGYIRQMCVMFCCESRLPVHLAYNADYPLQTFPLTNYVMRPNRWDKDKIPADQNIYPQYEEDYPREFENWKWGGFRFRQNINFEYANEPQKKFFSKPKFGFTEKTDFYTRTMWSFPRAINSQNVPGLRSFPALNSFDIDDAQGEIKRAYDCLSDKGSNLYAITEKGICLLLTKKSILSDLNASDIGYMASDKFISAEYWISKEIGMQDEFWRSAAEGNIPFTMENGSQSRQEALMWANKNGVFRMMNNSILDISRAGYYTRVINDGTKLVLSGYGTKMTAVFDRKNQWYWLLIGDTVYSYNQRKQLWNGTFEHVYDSLCAVLDTVIGMRKLTAYETDKGFILNGEPVKFKVTLASSKQLFEDKEFIRVRINSPETDKPTYVRFLDKVNGTELCSLNPTQGTLYLKNYRGWEQFIPRKNSDISPNRDRVQGRLLIWEIEHDLEEEFKLIDVGVQYKVLK